MSKSEFSYEELDELLEKMNETIQEKPELSLRLRPIVNEIQRLKVAMLELDELKQEFYCGDLTEDTYLTRRKKLRMDITVARNRITGNMLPELVKDAKDDETKSTWTKAKEAIRANKDVIILITQLATTILSKIKI